MPQHKPEPGLDPAHKRKKSFLPLAAKAKKKSKTTSSLSEKIEAPSPAGSPVAEAGQAWKALLTARNNIQSSMRGLSGSAPQAQLATLKTDIETLAASLDNFYQNHIAPYLADLQHCTPVLRNNIKRYLAEPGRVTDGFSNSPGLADVQIALCQIMQRFNGLITLHKKTIGAFPTPSKAKQDCFWFQEGGTQVPVQITHQDGQYALQRHDNGSWETINPADYHNWQGRKLSYLPSGELYFTLSFIGEEPTFARQIPHIEKFQTLSTANGKWKEASAEQIQEIKDAIPAHNRKQQQEVNAVQSPVALIRIGVRPEPTPKTTPASPPASAQQPPVHPSSPLASKSVKRSPCLVRPGDHSSINQGPKNRPGLPSKQRPGRNKLPPKQNSLPSRSQLSPLAPVPFGRRHSTSSFRSYSHLMGNSQPTQSGDEADILAQHAPFNRRTVQLPRAVQVVQQDPQDEEDYREPAIPGMDVVQQDPQDEEGYREPAIPDMDGGPAIPGMDDEEAGEVILEHVEPAASAKPAPAHVIYAPPAGYIELQSKPVQDKKHHSQRTVDYYQSNTEVIIGEDALNDNLAKENHYNLKRAAVDLAITFKNQWDGNGIIDLRSDLDLDTLSEDKLLLIKKMLTYTKETLLKMDVDEDKVQIDPKLQLHKTLKRGDANIVKVLKKRKEYFKYHRVDMERLV